MIEVHELTKRYGSRIAVEGVNFTVRPGVVTGFLGPNGSGKSTTMRMIMGLDACGVPLPGDGSGLGRCGPGRLGGVVVHTIALLIVRRVLGVLGCGPTPNADAVEIVVLRHQVALLHRQVARPRYTPADRMVLASIRQWVLIPR